MSVVDINGGLQGIGFNRCAPVSSGYTLRDKAGVMNPPGLPRSLRGRGPVQHHRDRRGGICVWHAVDLIQRLPGPNTTLVPSHGALIRKQDLNAYRDTLVDSRAKVKLLRELGKSPPNVAVTTRTPAWADRESVGATRRPSERVRSDGPEVPHAAYRRDSAAMLRAAFPGHPRRSSPHLQRMSRLGVPWAAVDNGGREAGWWSALVRPRARNSAKPAFQPYHVRQTE